MRLPHRRTLGRRLLALALGLGLAPLALAAGAPVLAQDAAAAPAPAPADDPTDDPRSELRVLLVSHDPEAPQVPFRDLATERTFELYRERAAAWEALLREHFRDVRVVYGPAYAPEMSAEVDVTLFDARPPVLREAVNETDPETGEQRYEPRAYLPDDFAHPALMIAENSPLIGEPLGLKLDWL